MKTATQEETISDVKARPTILCVDDDIDLLRAIELRLRSFDVDYLQAVNGDDGFIEALKHKPDVILLDLEMPNGNGIKTLEFLRHTAATRTTPVLILTGKHNPALKKKVIGLGANQFLTKPIQFEALQHELSRYIDFLRSVTDALSSEEYNDDQSENLSSR